MLIDEKYVDLMVGIRNKLCGQEVILWYSKDYLMVTQNTEELYLIQEHIDICEVSYVKSLLETNGLIVLEVINTDLKDYV